MMRTLLLVLAVVIAALAFVLNQVWMYWIAGALLAAAVMVVVARMWRRYQEAVQFQREEGESIPRHTELSELGIMEVRPQRGPSQEEEAADSPSDSSNPDAPPTAETGEENASAEATPPVDAASPEEDNDSLPDRALDATAPQEDPVLGPYLQALCAATESHAVCLLVQEDVMLTYRIAATVSRGATVRTKGMFETDEPLLSARMAQSALTVQPVGRDGTAPSQLGYYEEPPALEQVAFAPVPTPSATSTHFLVLDATDPHLHHPRAEKLITHFANLLGLLIESDVPVPAPEISTGILDEETTKPRPRREIIAEEIEKAMRSTEPLALALVHLNRAEQLAEQGKAVVADAESTLRSRLERSAPHSRVERFGELTFGVFHNRSVANVEPWAERLQDEMDHADGLLAGGVSIGVAMLRDDAQSPNQLRDDATEALRMAYETGTCTIVE